MRSIEIEPVHCGFSEGELLRLRRDIEAGYARFWAKRGGDPGGDGSWLERAERGKAIKFQNQ